MQIYSSPEFYGNFHINFPVTRSHQTNGMRTRMSALEYALELPVITDIAEAEGDLLIEPFAVRHSAESLQQILDYDKGRKYLICSEMEIFRWSGELRETVISEMDDVFSTCLYQQALLRAVGINSQILPEPVNPYLFYPTPKKPKQIVAIGSANHVKNTEMLIDFYKALEGKGYHRIYIGGPVVWANILDQKHEKYFQYNMGLYQELKSVCDEFHEATANTKVARILSESEYYANFAQHEVGCRTALEALLCGCGIVWGEHPLGRELPVVCMAKTVKAAVKALKKSIGTLDIHELREYAMQRYSFASVKQQLEGYMDGY